MLSTAIKTEKPWVKFGISPFGVWRNRDQDPIGSETKAGTTNYDGLYADVIYWQRMGWIDYLMPQLYWRDNHPAADFSSLAYWWSDFAYGRSMYFGLAPYRINKKSEYKLWKKNKYFLEQIDLLRSLDNINGWFYRGLGVEQTLAPDLVPHEIFDVAHELSDGFRIVFDFPERIPAAFRLVFGIGFFNIPVFDDPLICTL